MFLVVPATIVLYYGATLGSSKRATIGMQVMDIVLTPTRGQPLDGWMAIIHAGVFWLTTWISWPLSLLFARKDNAYLADVSVEIRGADGAPSVSLRADGPVCLIDLPAGRYDVQATSGGATQKQAVTVDRTPKTADFRF